MKVLGKITRRLLCTGLAVAAALFAYLRLGQDFIGDIQKQKLRWTRAGWVNFAHANPGGVTVFIEDLRRRWKAAHGQPFEITYSQQMYGQYFGLISVQAKVQRTYRISSANTETDLDRIAWGIFRAVTEAFETMQGAFPNAIDAASQDSAFRDGDLLGNRIAFYRALRGYSEERVASWLQPQSVSASLQQFQRTPILKNRLWDIPPIIAKTPLNELRHDPLWFVRHASLLTETQSWFKIRIL